MKEFSLMKGARRLVTVCGNLKAGEEVVIVTDFATMDVAKAVAKAALEISDNVNVLIMPVRTIDGQEPPAPIAAAMKKADLIFTPVKHSITHTFAVRDALGEGARAIMLTQYNTSMLERGGVFGDFEGIEPLCRKVGDLLGSADKVRLTTPNGTDLTLSVKDRPSNPHCGIVRKSGDFTTVPNIETSSSPVLGSAEGVIVADASVPYYGIGVLEEPIRFTVANGRVTKIEGGRQARELDKLLAKQGAPEVYNIAQISFGLNPDCPMEGVMLHDEGVYGTSHIGIGTSVLLGGEVKTLTHFDALMWLPTLELDGKIVLRDGEWLVPEASVVQDRQAAA